MLILLDKIKNVLVNVNYRVTIVDDASTLDAPINDFGIFSNVEIVQLNRNVGHQRAIAIGLAHINAKTSKAHVIIMDSDGEDNPDAIPLLMNELEDNNEKVIFAKRGKRSEGLIFSVFYFFYKLIFKLLTGKTIQFGNFCIIPYQKLPKIVYLTDIWNHFSGAVVKSRIEYHAVEIDRAKRYTGSSKMNFTSLIIHGLSAVSVHLETVLTRILIFSIILFVFAFVAIISAIIMKFVLGMTSPGWTTTVIIGSLILIFQLFLTTFLLTFQVLNSRSQRLFVPAIDYKTFIERIDNEQL
jgi:hypothetical protein